MLHNEKQTQLRDLWRMKLNTYTKVFAKKYFFVKGNMISIWFPMFRNPVLFQHNAPLSSIPFSNASGFYPDLTT